MIPLPCSPASETASLPQSPEPVAAPWPSTGTQAPLLPPGLEHHIQGLRTSHSTSEVLECDTAEDEEAIEEGDNEDDTMSMRPEVWLQPVRTKVHKLATNGPWHSLKWRPPVYSTKPYAAVSHIRCVLQFTMFSHVLMSKSLAALVMVSQQHSNHLLQLWNTFPRVVHHAHSGLLLGVTLQLTNMNFSGRQVSTA